MKNHSLHLFAFVFFITLAAQITKKRRKKTKHNLCIGRRMETYYVPWFRRLKLPNAKQQGSFGRFAKYQLYNLKNAPSETTNAIATYPEKVEALKALLIKYIVEGRSTPGTKQKNDSIDFDWQQIGFIE